MKILFIGDIVGNEGVDFVKQHLKSIKKLKGIDFFIANGENAAGGKGIMKSQAIELFDCGIDVLTMGNHTYNKQDIFELLEDYNVIRPANMPHGSVGTGCIELEVGDTSVCVINARGRVYVDPPLDCPFAAVDDILKKAKSNIIFIDFHAEATSEKLALAKYLDGRISALVGTHTHVTTADEQILPKGTAYITDVGMTGTTNGIIGVKDDLIISKYLTALPTKFELAEGNTALNAVIVDVDEDTGKAISIERLRIC